MTHRLHDRNPLFFLLVLIGLTLIAKPSFSQTDSKSDLTKQFQQYQQDAFQEKVFVHVDRSFYLAGETIWFKVYDVDEYFNRPLSLSGVAYVELLDKEQKPVLQASIGIKEGKGNGSFLLPSSLRSGNYILRAYTSWMKNFPPDFYFHQALTVINTLNQSPGNSLVPANSPNGTAASHRSAQDSAAAAQLSGMTIQFFPEGGHLVSGLPSKLAFKASNGRGEGLFCRGVIIDQKNDTISRFQSTRFGMGNFLFTPVKGDSYRALVEINDSPVTTKLPAIYDQGYTMSLVDMDKDRLKIVVYSNLGMGNPGPGLLAAGNPAIYLFVHTRQLVKNVQAGFLTNGQTIFYLDKKSLGEGLSHITLFNADKAPICERLYFNRPAQLSITATTAAAEPASASAGYRTRQKVVVDLSTSDPSGSPVQADMSLSVFSLDSLQSIPKENILTYLLLTSELRGRVESPQYYFENNSEEASAALDNLLLTQGWTRFRWENVLQGKKPFFEFLAERDGPVVTGKLVDKRTGRPAPSLTGYLSIPGKYFVFSPAVSRPNGDIRFHVKDFYGNSEIILQTNSREDSNYRIELSNPYAEVFSSPLLPDFRFPEKWKSQLLYPASINTQVENTYRISQKHRLVPANVADTLPFYGHADQQYNLDDYTRFTTFEEVIREYVLNVRLKQKSGKSEFRILNRLFNTFFEEPPLLLLDGIPIFDADKLMAMDPLRIKSLDVVTHRYYTNSLISDGILSCKTYEGDLGGYTLDPNAVAVQYAGLQQQREFYTPVYDDSAQVHSPIPDFRNLLLWSPDLSKRMKRGKSTAFFLHFPDQSGTFALVIQAITEEGLPGSVIRTFTVSK